MENKDKLNSALQELRTDNAKKQKLGLHFIITSVFLWGAIFIIHLTSLPILTKNFYTFFCSALLFPLAFMISKLIGVNFQNKGNPLTNLGIIFSVNQMIYILIAMWVYASVPDKMLMVYAMIFGSHLLPFGWLYQSKPYYVLSVFIPIAVLLIGLHCSTVVIAGIMFLIEILFSVCLIVENKMRKQYKSIGVGQSV